MLQLIKNFFFVALLKNYH